MCRKAVNRRPFEGGDRRLETQTTTREEIVDSIGLEKADLHVNGGYLDRFGNAHTAAVFEHWSPRVIRAMGIRPLVEGGSDAQ
jgi:hypothetical protein